MIVLASELTFFLPSRRYWFFPQFEKTGFRMLQIIFRITALCLLVARPVMAQQEDPSSLLPEIDPQDIEIRGDFEVRFQGLARQPILGFSPRPAVFRVDPARMPFLETDDEIVSAIPISDLEPALKPQKQFLVFSERSSIYVKGGFGRFFSPEFIFAGEMPLRPGETLIISLDHLSSAGNRDFSSFRDLNSEVQWSLQKGRNRYDVGLYGLNAFNYSPIPTDTTELALPGAVNLSDLRMDPQRLTVQAYGAEVQWQRFVTPWRGWRVNAGAHHFNNDSPLRTGEKGSASENRYDIRALRFWEGGAVEQVFGIMLRAAGSVYDTGLAGDQYWLTNSMSARYDHLFGNGHKLEARLRLYQLYDPVNSFDMYLYPDIRYRYGGMRRFHGSFRIQGYVKEPDLKELYQGNRFFLQNGKELEHERGLNIALHGGIRLTRQFLVYTGLDYWQFYNSGYYDTLDRLQSPYYSYLYTDDALRVEWYQGMALALPFWSSKLSLETGLNYSSIESDDVETGVIPYTPRWQGTMRAHMKPLSMLHFSVWFDYTGKRKTSRTEETLDGFFQLAAEANLRLHDNLGIYFKALNMLNQDYEVWQNYLEQPLQFFGGVTLHW